MEIDDMWSFVERKGQRRWLWAALFRRTRQIVAFVISDRRKSGCCLFEAIPKEYRRCHSFGDFGRSKIWFFQKGYINRFDKRCEELEHI
ncbi:MAG: IS1 family transposase [Armatimonadetes bacterium]|nr:IS1 family transposase [Armatimonadota bacterium]MCX7776833.1 IS1 family transposase [Armatimonadota bacterium]